MGLGQHSEGDAPLLTTTNRILIYGGQPQHIVLVAPPIKGDYYEIKI